MPTKQEFIDMQRAAAERQAKLAQLGERVLEILDEIETRPIVQAEAHDKMRAILIQARSLGLLDQEEKKPQEEKA